MRVRKPFDLIYEDEDVVVVNKAPGIYCIPPRKGPDGKSLLELVNRRYGKALTVHRIDKNTTGVVLFAREEAKHRELSMLFQKRQVQKTYLAITKGTWINKEGEIDFSLTINSRGKVRIDHKGKKSLTAYEVVEYFNGYALVSLKPHTGRQHQIRVHLLASGCPLAVDSLYADPGPLTISQLKQKKYSGQRENEGTILERMPLHAHILELPDGVLAKNTFEAALPKDMRACISQLRKWRSV